MGSGASAKPDFENWETDIENAKPEIVKAQFEALSEEERTSLTDDQLRRVKANMKIWEMRIEGSWVDTPLEPPANIKTGDTCTFSLSGTDYTVVFASATEGNATGVFHRSGHGRGKQQHTLPIRLVLEPPDTHPVKVFLPWDEDEVSDLPELASDCPDEDSVVALNKQLLGTMKKGEYDVGEMKRLLVSRADPNAVSALNVAVGLGKASLISRSAVKLLLQSRADPNIPGTKDPLVEALHHAGGLQIIGSDNHDMGVRNKWLIGDLFAAGLTLKPHHLSSLSSRNDDERTINGIDIGDMLLQAAAESGQHVEPGVSWSESKEKLHEFGFFTDEDMQKQLQAEEAVAEAKRNAEAKKQAEAKKRAASQRVWSKETHVDGDDGSTDNSSTSLTLDSNHKVVLETWSHGDDGRSDAIIWNQKTTYTGRWAEERDVVVMCQQVASIVECTSIGGECIAKLEVPPEQEPYGPWLAEEISKLRGRQLGSRLVLMNDGGEIFWPEGGTLSEGQTVLHLTHMVSGTHHGGPHRSTERKDVNYTVRVTLTGDEAVIDKGVVNVCFSGLPRRK